VTYPDVLIFGSITEAEDLLQQWEQLSVGGASAIYTSPSWCLAAWRNFTDLGPPHLVASVDRRRLLGLLPLTVGLTGLTWPGGALGDEHDVWTCGDRSHIQIGSALLRAATASGSLQTLPDVRPDSILIRVTHSRQGSPAPALPLRDPDPEFGQLACIPGWSRGRRRGLRSSWRRLARLGVLDFERVTEPEHLTSALPPFVAARLGAWQRRGRLAELPAMDRHPNFPAFITEIGGELAAQGRCFLAVLQVDGTPIAQSLLFRVPGAYLLYMSTYEEDLAGYSPSHLLLAQVAAAGVADGVRILELGRGDEPYKFDLGAEQRWLRDVLAPDGDQDHESLLLRSPV
jgi:CelD/BcsL family acetyltransferase involved in cellulose biosynthesis